MVSDTTNYFATNSTSELKKKKKKKQVYSDTNERI